MVFGDTPVKQVSLLKAPELAIKAISSVADEIIKSTGINDGYAAIYGTTDIKLLKSSYLKNVPETCGCLIKTLQGLNICVNISMMREFPLTGYLF